MHKIILLILLVFLGCSSLDRKAQMKNTPLIIGKSTTQYLVKKIGLPNKVVKEPARDLWLYSDEAENKSIYFPIPLGSSISVINVIDIKIDHSNSNIKMIYAFDKNGILVNVFKSK